MEQQYDVRELLEYINPASLDYQEWINVGMALKESGYSASDWDSWSRADSRYHSGECFTKWTTFNGATTPVTAGTIVQMAKDNGWIPSGGDSHELDWNDVIGGHDELVIIDKEWVEGQEVIVPEESWSPTGELVTYLETLFDSTENVGYVTETWEKDGKYLPTKGCWDRTAGELIQALNKCKGDIGSVLGDYKPEAGAWIRFNPLDGNGCKNDNVSDYRYALVESDIEEIEKQNAIIRELELPVATLVHSGKKSLHAIVKIDAPDYQEYRKRVDYLYDVCKKNGLKVDTQNKNPSRLSRMPGIMRNGNKQFLIDTNIGKENWAEWKEWIEGINDDLPDPESLASEWDNLPELANPLIVGVLRQGHKMLIAGPSKAGKSFALIEMCIAIAEGRKWINWSCAKGKVLYVNLELDRASCLHRFKDVYEALGWTPDNINNIDIWNLRGKSVPMDKLSPKMIRRASKKNYIAIVIDPIYKVITGDENSADQMAHFCNQFDKVCTELGCAVIYCHHHSKGGQGGKKSMDRASGSGVFARDPDALLDLLELELTEPITKLESDKARIRIIEDYLSKNYPDWEDDVSQDDRCSYVQMLKYVQHKILPKQFRELEPVLDAAERKVMQMTAWRVEGTLREFAKFNPVNLWFDYPVHRIDQSGALQDVAADGDLPAWQRAINKRKPKEQKAKNRKVALEEAYEAQASFAEDGVVTIPMLEESLGVAKNTVKNYIKEHPDFEYENGVIKKVSTVSSNKQ